MKTAIAMILAALATTSTATAPAANPTVNESGTIFNPVAFEYAEEFRATTAEVTGIEQNPDFATSVFVTADGHEWAICDELTVGVEYLAVFDTMGTENILDDEIIAMIPVTK